MTSGKNKELQYGVGIDFGTTKSHLSIIDLQTGQQALSRGRVSTEVDIPTIIFANRKRNRNSEDFKWQYEIGQDALNGTSDSGDYIFADDVKRRLRSREKYDYEVSPEILAAAILRKIYATASFYQEPDNITITIPADIGMNNRASMMYATRLAGLSGHNVNLLEEPLAAFLGFYKEVVENSPKKQKELEGKRILVFDFGGGTCDVASILIGNENTPPIVERKASDSNLGGKNVSTAMREFIFKDKYVLGTDSSDLIYQMETKSENWKESISLYFWKNLSIQGFSNFLQQNHPRRREILLERIDDHPIQFNHLKDLSTGRITSELFKFTAADFDHVVTNCLSEPIAKLLGNFTQYVNDYAYVLLVGGSSLLPHVSIQIYDWLKTHGVSKPETKIWKVGDPIRHISQGAALYQFYQAKGVLPVQPLMDRNLSLITRPEIYIASNRNFETTYEANGIDILIPANQHLPFPNNNLNSNLLSKNSIITDSVLPNGKIASVLRKEYLLEEEKQTLLFMENNELIDARIIKALNTENTSDLFFQLDLRVNQSGLLELYYRFGSEAPMEELEIDFDHNPNNRTDIQETIRHYNLNFPLD